MNAMDPKTAQNDQQPGAAGVTAVPASPPMKNQPVSYSGLGGKEAEPGVGLGNFEIPELSEIGRDVELPKDVERAGVKVIPSATPYVPIKQTQNVQYGSPAAQTVAASAAGSVPLTDDQIAAGLKQSIKSSWLWLAQWCVRKMKQLARAGKK